MADGSIKCGWNIEMKREVIRFEVFVVWMYKICYGVYYFGFVQLTGAIYIPCHTAQTESQIRHHSLDSVLPLCCADMFSGKCIS